ncbi:MAG: hypothetical protein AB1716_06395 [Planctomycetota bacterium]
MIRREQLAHGGLVAVLSLRTMTDAVPGPLRPPPGESHQLLTIATEEPRPQFGSVAYCSADMTVHLVAIARRPAGVAVRRRSTFGRTGWVYPPL